MESYHVISGIKIKGTNIISVANGDSIFEKQGTVDGACGPYSLFMTLKILGELSQTDVNDPDSIDKRRSAYKFMSRINKLKGLIIGGTYLRNLYDLINDNFITKLETDWSQKKNHDLISFIVGSLEENKPTIIKVDFTSGAHWMVAVGYSTNEKGKHNKLLFLDPSGEKPTFSPWNSVLDISTKRKSEFPYNWTTAGYNVSLEEALSISHK